MKGFVWISRPYAKDRTGFPRSERQLLAFQNRPKLTFSQYAVIRVPWLIITRSTIEFKSVRRVKTVVVFTPEMFLSLLKLVYILYLAYSQIGWLHLTYLATVLIQVMLILTHRLFSNSVSNLQEKWRDMFNFRDIIKDNILDMADVTLIQDNYVRIRNLTAEEVCTNQEKMHERFKDHTLWRYPCLVW